MEPWVPGLLTGVFAVLVATVSGYFQNRKEIADRLSKNSSPTPPSTAEVWARLDSTERALKAAVELLEELAEQWPGKTGPKLPKRAVNTLSELGYLPREWDPKEES